MSKNETKFKNKPLFVGKPKPSPLPTPAPQEAPVPARRSTLLEADQIVNGPRQADYGDPVANFTRAAVIAQAMGVHVSPVEVVRVLKAVKIARHAHRPSRDNLVDLNGYSEIEAILLDL